MRQEPRLRSADIPVAELRAFAAVVEHGGFSRAADALAISQPTVSLRLQNLEEHLGLRLLDRRSGVTLTEPGRELYNRARQILTQIDQFDATAGDLRALRSGRLRVGFSTPAFAMPALGRLRRAHPDLSLALSAGNTASLIAEIEACAIDAAIMTLRAPPDGLATRLIAEQELILLSPAGPDAPRTLNWDDLASATVILREKGSITRELFEEAAAQSGARPAKLLEAPTREAVREAVAAGLGLGVVLSGEAGRDARIAASPIEGVKTRGGVYVAAAPDARALPAVAALFDVAAPGAATAGT
jgi:DNA-binding transcriptional LysR family regulator